MSEGFNEDMLQNATHQETNRARHELRKRVDALPETDMVKRTTGSQVQRGWRQFLSWEIMTYIAIVVAKHRRPGHNCDKELCIAIVISGYMTRVEANRFCGLHGWPAISERQFALYTNRNRKQIERTRYATALYAISTGQCPRKLIRVQGLEDIDAGGDDPTSSPEQAPAKYEQLYEAFALNSMQVADCHREHPDEAKRYETGRGLAIEKMLKNARHLITKMPFLLY